jgi:hypothetical protein
MSVWRGIQSVIFFYVSCAPCSDAATRKKRNRQAVHDERQRTELEAAHPDYPTQAAPGSVNPHWQIEIDSGPMTMSKQRTMESDFSRTRSRELNKTERRDSKRELRPSATQTSTASSRLQSTAEVKYTQRHLMVYQRPDEELWGAPSSSTVNLPTRPGTARTKSSATNIYHQARHPAVKITDRDEVSWMLQPLPSAAVMTGKEQPQPSISRSNSDVSGPSPRSTKSISSPLTPIEASYPSEETIVHTPDSSEHHLGKPEDWIWETTKRDVSARRSLEW